MKAETIIYCLFSALKPIFAGIKIPPEKKIKAIIPYLHGLSYRQVAEIWETVQKLAKTIYQPSQ